MGDDFERINFGCCGATALYPRVFMADKRETGDRFYCPNGHCRVFKDSDTDRLRRERDRLKQQQAQWNDERRMLNATIEAEKRSAAAARGQVTKLRKRVSTGTCPCCNRHFDNLQRHMEAKHPDMVEHKVVPIKRQAS